MATKKLTTLCSFLATVSAGVVGFENEIYHESMVTVRASPNIALIKYWGKRDQILMLPHHSSISITLDGDNEVLYGDKNIKLFTTTSVLISNRLTHDELYINEELITSDDQSAHGLFRAIKILRDIADSREKMLIVSENLFPTAAGLASSASGIAALVFAVSMALKLDLSSRQLSIIARMGSGSASRSVIGGVVRWNSGLRDDGSDSFAQQIYSPNYWPEIVDLIAIVSLEEKKTSSRDGMAATVKSSGLYKERVRGVDERLQDLENAFREQNLVKLAKIVMIESNNMHATMLDTSPPIMYLDDTSREIMHAIEDLNRDTGSVIAGYTFDAGPNAHIITVKKYVGIITDRLSKIEGIKTLIMAGVGEGPRLLDSSDSLINREVLKPRDPSRAGALYTL
jgi:diphosphomevalonate decarboxylase